MKRWFYLCLAFGTMTLGLLSRANGVPLPHFVAIYAGDTLWALLVYWILRLISPHQSSVRAAVLAIVFAFGIELSQLYQADWIEAVRRTRLGGLVLGYGFKISDLFCYMVGVALGFGIDNLLPFGRTPKRPSKA